MSTQPTNSDVASVFSRLADYLEVAGENPFKTRAYRNAADLLVSLDEPIAQIAAAGRLRDLPGFGDAIVSKTQDILATGTTAAYEAMRAKIPEGVLDFLSLPGIGVKTVAQLWNGLHVDSLDALEAAAREGRVQGLKGMSEKTAAKILEAIERRSRFRGVLLVDSGSNLAETLRDHIAADPSVQQIEIAGDLRRGCETVSQLTIVASSLDFNATLDAASSSARVSSVIDRSADRIRLVLGGRAQADVYVCAPALFGALLASETGSAAHVTRLRALAAKRGMEPAFAAPDEDAFYAALGLPPISPPLREDRGEIEAALAGTLPNLIRVSDIRGNLHQHTTASDGHDTLEDMAVVGKQRGYEYMAITDHSQALAMTNGLTVERLRAQIREVREVEQRVGIRLLAGSEVDILGDGTMDFPDDVLAELDIVIASVHSRFNLPREEMTARIVRAVSNPHVDILAHPTGRLLASRDAYAVDMDAVIAAAHAGGAALEINASPERLDMNEYNARKAAEAGVPVAINTDAHRVGHLDFLRHGVAIAQRAWLEPRNVVNSLALPELLAWLHR
ncbi:MAG: DNA polymerase/3'-5' exonuclease PolX [Capsulimonadaceae bacterium]|nr:DNA polymerase/3'-5' exonuclease PolX [Capsulimonadaceae bacterium]